MIISGALPLLAVKISLATSLKVSTHRLTQLP